MPAIPFLGALPTSELTFGFVGILVPVVAAYVITTLLRPAIERALGHDDTLLMRAVAGASTGVVGGLLIGLLAAVASGSAGPGRLADVGADGLVVGAFAALEIGIPAILALVVRQGEWDALSRVRATASGVGRRSPTPERSPGRSAGPEAQDDIPTEKIDGLTR